jgi:hypothetical protein
MANRAANNPEMEGPMCCFCIPIRYGVILIAIYQWIDTAQTIVQANGMKDVSKIVFGFFIAALFPAMVAVYINLKYLCMTDSFENRRHLTLGCGLSIVSVCI